MLLRELKFYSISGVIGAVVFAFCYGYLKWLGIPGELNKAAADTAIILIAFSMLQSSLSYYFNFMDHAIIYRKYFGLIGFAFAIAHLILSWGALANLFNLETWMQGRMLPILTGTLAFLIFTIMAVISNTYFTKLLGSEAWRRLLRVGYLAIVFVLSHVVLLKSARWIMWFEGGMKTAPSLSLLVSVFMVVVVVLRLCMWWSLRRGKSIAQESFPQPAGDTTEPE